jgi:hypothetical protein
MNYFLNNSVPDYPHVLLSSLLSLITSRNTFHFSLVSAVVCASSDWTGNDVYQKVLERK